MVLPNNEVPCYGTVSTWHNWLVCHAHEQPGIVVQEDEEGMVGELLHYHDTQLAGRPLGTIASQQNSEQPQLCSNVWQN